MSGFVDMHSHVIPGIDDGPPDLEQSLEMLRAAALSGVATVAATPHLRADFPDVDVHQIADRCDSLRRELLKREIEIEVVPAAEVSLTWAMEAGAEQLALASYGQRGTDLLIETPLTTVAGIDALLYGLRARGFRITLAHPERGREFQQDDSALRALRDQGVLLQVNAGTLIGDERRSPGSKLGRRLCREGLVHAIASDGHRARDWRAVTELASAFETVCDLAGEERARWMMSDVPAAIVAGRAIPAAPALAAPSRRRRWTWR